MESWQYNNENDNMSHWDFDNLIGESSHQHQYEYQYEQQQPFLSFENEHFDGRSLAGGGDISIDYTVFGMVLVTMIFLLVVDVLRHRIDHLARGNDFFETVMEAVYHELSTLGIVEAFVFILHKYYEGLVIETEQVFAQVHFTLFFVVVINAVASIILYLLACRVANKQWVRMEAIDLDHYVAVRKQFDDVNKQLEELKANETLRKIKRANKKGSKHYRRTVSFDLRGAEDGPCTTFEHNHEHGHGHEGDDNDNHDHNQDHNHAVSSASLTSENESWFRKFWKHGVTKNVLKKRHRELLVQVRFHEMRVHFIEAHKLPPNFRVSDYLKLCLTDEFKNLVHVTTLSWLILIIFTNIIYFVMGILYFKTKDDKNIGTALTSIYLGYASCFVLLSYIVSLKMKQVFYKIVKDETWIQVISEEKDNNDKGVDEVSEKSWRNSNSRLDASSRSLGNLSSATVNPTEHRGNQNEYFWGSNPGLVVVIAQLMQFGYAICFGVLLVFNDVIQSDTSIWYWWYPIVPLFCYMLFLSLWCIIMPKYTQCTSLGELVRKKHLIDIDARSKLEKATTKRQEEIDYLLAEKEVAKNMEERTAPAPRQRQRQDSSQSNLLARLMGKRSGVKDNEVNDKALDASQNDGSLSASERLLKISAFVKQPTKDLPDDHDHISRRRRQRQRSRSVSDGVAAMRLFSSKSAVAEEALKADSVDSDPLELPKGLLEALPTRQPGSRRTRKKMASTGVYLMQSENTPSFFGGDSDSKRNETLAQFRRAPLPLPEERKTKTEKGDGTFLSGIKTMPSERQVHRISSKESFKLAPVHESIETIKHQDEPVIPDTFSDESSIISEEESVEVREVDSSEIETVEHVSLGERLRKFLLHRRYALTSAVFGTMVAFFCLSTRVEMLLLDTCTLKDNLNTFNFFPTRTSAFWIIVGCFCLFLVESIITSFLFGRRNEYFNKVMVIAAIMDIILTCICLGLFLWAETERCYDECTEHSVFFKAKAAKGDSYQKDDYGCTVKPEDLCCPPFGSRLYGGVGSIEPITCIIALRLFRFETARFLVSCFNNMKRIIFKEENEGDETNLHNDEETSNEKKEGVAGKSDKKIDFKHQNGTIAELWVLALAEYPDIVKEHGIFSGLILEAMLGINPLPGTAEKDSKTPDRPDDPKKDASHLLTVESIIEAGKTKRPKSLQRGISALSVRSAGGSSVADLHVDDHNLLRPSAPLIRSMRRCECQWKWLKSATEMPWEMVDIVVTEYEIVWFDATSNPTYWDETELKRIQNVKEAIIAKKGGKGLRLSDVAAGREILGRLALKDVDHIRISRIQPSSMSSHSNADVSDDVLDLEENGSFVFSRKVISKEYWNDTGEGCNMQLPLQKQFEQVTEDRLRLHSDQGTLYLRFLVDLYGVVEPTLSQDEIEKKKGALLWCESISHLCGKSQLKQKLPHFGEDRDHELQDFIETSNRMKEGDDKRSRKWRIPSYRNLNQLH